MSEMNMPWDALLRVGEVTYPPGGAFGPRLQRNLQLVYLEAGAMRVFLDDSTFDVEAGQLILLTPGHEERFAFAVTTESRHGWCEAVDFDPEAPLCRAVESNRRVAAASKRLFKLADTALRFRTDSGPGGAELFQACARAVLLEGLECLGMGEDHPEPPQLRAAVAFMRAAVAEIRTLEEIAEAASVSATHLIRLFREHRGTTPIAYLWTLRAERGRRLLLDSGLTVEEVAGRCGFKTASHFSRAIKSHYGLPPRELRRLHWRANASR